MGLTGATQLAVGEDHTCGLLADGTAKCWGRAYWGAIGDGKTGERRITPTAVVDLTDATQLVVGAYRTCALRGDGTVACWGNNDLGELGDGTDKPSYKPQPVPGLTAATQLATGYFHVCALLADGTAKCWGRNDL